MKKTIIASLVLASVAFASEDRAPEMTLFTLGKKEMVRDSVSVKAPPQKGIETEMVASVETPFQRVAWENGKTFNDEFRVMNLGIGF